MEVFALHDLDIAMARLADGDRDVSRDVFHCLLPLLLAFAERTLGRGPDADDAVQQALEKLFAQASQYNSDRPALAWALAITTWECRTTLQRRRRRREEPLERADSVISQALDPSEESERRALLSALRVTLAGLPMSDQTTLEDAFFRETQSAQEPALRKRKERALTRLRDAWRKAYGD